MTKKLIARTALLVTLAASSLLLVACNDSDSESDSVAETESNSDSSASDTSADTVSTEDCDSDQDIETLLCAITAFKATLSSSELTTVSLDWDESSAKSTWSNLPNASRNGLMFGDLSDESRTAAMTVAKAALSESGYEDFVGILAADDYLGQLGDSGQGGGGGGGSSMYTSDNYYIAFIGTPSSSGNWMLQIGGHHLAYNITYIYGEGYPAPNHIGVEPKSSFELSATSYAPLKEEGDALVSMFDSLSSAELSEAYLSGETYSDVLVGPDNGSTVLPSNYPTGDDRAGKLVYELSESQRELVIAAIEQWVGDYAGDVAEARLAEYTSEEALADTYIAWAGTESAGVDVDVANTYMRIDGPRLWIEVACQQGVVISDETHYHTMFRDKSMDYGNSL